MEINKKKLFRYVAVTLLTGALSSILTKTGMADFMSLNKPPLSPPALLFPIVWTILYILMGISAYIIDISSQNTDKTSESLKIYYYQLIVNFLWPLFFFNFEWYLFSFVWLVFLWILVALMIKNFSKISKTAAYLNIPYLVWLTFAGYLNFSIWLLNK